MANANSQDQSATCPECQFGPFERNHFFTGKLMTARDFSDETRYHSDRMRHHNARLHGWGVVCGLKVRAHDNPACRDKFVIIEPGTALDCCGNEILVTEAVTVELDKLPAIADLIKKKDSDPHRLQICVSYKECPREEVPVLYDECGCDDGRCAPNRILSSFEVDAILDAARTIKSTGVPGLKYATTINPPHAAMVVLHADTKRMYAIASDQMSVYQLDTETSMVVGTATLKAQPVGLAVSNKGDRLYAVVDTGKKRQLIALDTAKFDGTALNSVDIPNGEAGPIYLAVAPSPDNRLLSLAGQAGELAVWPVDLDKRGSGSSLKPILVELGKDLAGLAIASNGKTAYTVDQTNNQVVVATFKSKTNVAKSQPLSLPERTDPSGLALIASSAPDLLAVFSNSGKSMVVVDPKNNKSLGGTGLDYAPAAATVAAGGHWAYVLENDGQKSYVQPVDVTGIQQGVPQVTGEAVPVGDNSQAVVVTPSGNQLYVPSEGDPNQVSSGGVSVVTVDVTKCADIFWKSLDGCPACDTPNCVVLATIDDYVVGDKVEDQTDPAADPLADQADGVARIDNRTDRKLLPSTETLTEVVECLLEQGCDCTGGGTQGPPGQPGAGVTVVPEPAGPNCTYGGIKVTDGKGQVTYVCDGAPGTNGLPGTPGAAGPGLEPGLTQIKALSWTHNSENNPPMAVARLATGVGAAKGYVIEFTNKVHVLPPTAAGQVDHSINDHHVYQVFVLTKIGALIRSEQLAGTIVPVKVTDDGLGHITTATEILDIDANAVAFLLDLSVALKDVTTLNLQNSESVELRICLQGDFVVDVNGKAVDAEFARAELPTGDRPSGSNYGIQGGLFESWLWTGKKS